MTTGRSGDQLRGHLIVLLTGISNPSCSNVSSVMWAERRRGTGGEEGGNRAPLRKGQGVGLMRAQISAPLHCCALHPSQRALLSCLSQLKCLAEVPEEQGTGRTTGLSHHRSTISQQSGATLFRSINSDQSTIVKCHSSRQCMCLLLRADIQYLQSKYLSIYIYL